MTGIAPPPFQTFLDAHRRPVLRFLAAVAGPNDAEDCLQETFLAALRAYPRLRADSDLRAWVMKIAHRKAIDAARARGRRPTPVADVPERWAAADGSSAGAAPSATASSDREPDLWALVRELPPRQRAAVAHRFVGDLSYAEVGRAMSCSEEAARRSVHEAMRTLRKEWRA